MRMPCCLQTLFPNIPLGAAQPVKVDLINDSETGEDVTVAVGGRSRAGRAACCMWPGLIGCGRGQRWLHVGFAGLP